MIWSEWGYGPRSKMLRHICSAKKQATGSRPALRPKRSCSRGSTGFASRYLARRSCQDPGTHWFEWLWIHDQSIAEPENLLIGSTRYNCPLFANQGFRPSRRRVRVVRNGPACHASRIQDISPSGHLTAVHACIIVHRNRHSTWSPSCTPVTSGHSATGIHAPELPH